MFKLRALADEVQSHISRVHINNLATLAYTLIKKKRKKKEETSLAWKCAFTFYLRPKYMFYSKNIKFDFTFEDKNCKNVKKKNCYHFPQNMLRGTHLLSINIREADCMRWIKIKFLS